MRKTLLVGVVLGVAAVVVVLLGDLLDLKLDSTALLGVALGAVVALAPDATPVHRLIGFAVGLCAAWAAFVARAAVLPDSATGRAVAVGLVVAVCVAFAVASADRLPLWSTLLGAAGMVGAYEFTYNVAPPEVVSTSTTAVTSLLLTVAVGFASVLLAAPAERAEAGSETPGDDDVTPAPVMETTK